MKKAVIFDIDGTLAEIGQRRAILEEDPHDWKSFFEAMGNDTPNESVVELYRLVWDSSNYQCIIVSGRPKRYQKLTEQWLTWNNISFDRLIMRDDNDNRPDHIIKEEILKSLISERLKISFVVDDRKSVVDMWRRNGLTCFQCADFDG